MWKWLWTEHRSRLYAVAGMILFLLSGMAVSFFSSEHSPREGERQPRNVITGPAPAYNENILASDAVQKTMEKGPSPVPAELPHIQAPADPEP